MTIGVWEIVAGASGDADTVDDVALDARFNYPVDMCYHPDGYIYVVSVGDMTLRRFDISTLTVETIYAATEQGAAVCVDQSTGKVYAAFCYYDQSGNANDFYLYEYDPVLDSTSLIYSKLGTTGAIRSIDAPGNGSVYVIENRGLPEQMNRISIAGGTSTNEVTTNNSANFTPCNVVNFMGRDWHSGGQASGGRGFVSWTHPADDPGGDYDDQGGYVKVAGYDGIGYAKRSEYIADTIIFNNDYGDDVGAYEWVGGRAQPQTDGTVDPSPLDDLFLATSRPSDTAFSKRGAVIDDVGGRIYHAALTDHTIKMFLSDQPRSRTWVFPQRKASGLVVESPGLYQG